MSNCNITKKQEYVSQNTNTLYNNTQANNTNFMYVEHTKVHISK